MRLFFLNIFWISKDPWLRRGKTRPVFIYCQDTIFFCCQIIITFHRIFILKKAVMFLYQIIVLLVLTSCMKANVDRKCAEFKYIETLLSYGCFNFDSWQEMRSVFERAMFHRKEVAKTSLFIANSKSPLILTSELDLDFVMSYFFTSQSQDYSLEINLVRVRGVSVTPSPSEFLVLTDQERLDNSLKVIFEDSLIEFYLDHDKPADEYECSRDIIPANSTSILSMLRHITFIY